MKDRYCVWVYLYKVPRIGKFTETESRIKIARLGGGRGCESSHLTGAAWDDEKKF